MHPYRVTHLHRRAYRDTGDADRRLQVRRTGDEHHLGTALPRRFGKGETGLAGSGVGDVAYRIDRLLRRAGGDDHRLAAQDGRPPQRGGHGLDHGCGGEAPAQLVRGAVRLRHAGVTQAHPGVTQALYVLLHQRMLVFGGTRGAGEHRRGRRGVQQHGAHERLVGPTGRRLGDQRRGCGHHHQAVGACNQIVQGMEVLRAQASVQVAGHDHVAIDEAAEGQGRHESLGLGTEHHPHAGAGALQGAQYLDGRRRQRPAANAKQDGFVLQHDEISRLTRRCSGVVGSAPGRRAGCGGARRGQWPSTPPAPRQSNR